MFIILVTVFALFLYLIICFTWDSSLVAFKDVFKKRQEISYQGIFVVPNTLIPIIILLFLFPATKGPLSGQRQFLTIENPSKMMKNTFCFMLKAIYVLGVFTFLSWLFSCVEKQLDTKAKGNYKIYDFTDWITNNYKTHYQIS